MDKLRNTEINSTEKPALIDELEEEIERQLEAKARKNKLSVSNVKNMIKAVITNEEVLSLMDFNLNMTQKGPPYEPKLTRAKTRELLAKESAPVVWPGLSSPRKSDIAELINQDLPDDSSDEEYNPLNDVSDEESKLDESLMETEFIGPQESLQGTALQQFFAPPILLENIKSEEENIGQRTRSKFSLSETTLEAIEQAFVPPDITMDMYNTDCENQDWLDFLKEFMQPMNSTDCCENNDDENDPEYNVMVDVEHEGTDREELRMDRAVKVSKKELNALRSEFYDYTEMLSSDDEKPASNVNKENMDNNNAEFKLIRNSSFQAGIQAEDTSLNVKIGHQNEENMFKPQRSLFEQQLRQHIQLSLTNFLLSSCHPLLHKSFSNGFKSMTTFWETRTTHDLMTILCIQSSLNFIRNWECILNDSKTNKEIKRFILKEEKIAEDFRKKKKLYRTELPPHLICLCKESTAFFYPLMLPTNGFTAHTFKNSSFTTSEINLIILGLDEYYSQISETSGEMTGMSKAVQYLCDHKLPVWSVATVRKFIQRLQASKKVNPVKCFIENKIIPEISHYVISLPNSLIKLCDQPLDILSTKWLTYLKKTN